MSTATVRDLQLVSETVKEAIVERVRAALLAWGQMWLPISVHHSPEIASAVFEDLGCDWLSSDQEWTARRGAESSNLTGWSASQMGSAERLSALLLARESHKPSEGDWALFAALHAIEELNSAILGGCDSTSTAGPDLEMLSGVLLVVERRLGLCWAFLPSSSNDANSASAAAKRAPERLSTVLSGVTSHRLRLGVGLGDVEIQVSDLLALQPGDVIRFPSQLQGSVPVSVAITGKVTQAALAQLGQQDGHLAVKFLSQHRAV